MKVIKRLLVACCTAIVIASLLPLAGNAQQGPILNLSPEVPIIQTCELKRSPTGVVSLTITGTLLREGAEMTIGGISPKKLKFKDQITGQAIYKKIVAKGRLCRLLPGTIVVTNPDGMATSPFHCNQRCEN